MLGSMLPSVVQSTAHEERQREFSGPTSHHLRLLVQAGWDSQGQALQVSVNNTETACRAALGHPPGPVRTAEDPIAETRSWPCWVPVLSPPGRSQEPQVGS